MRRNENWTLIGEAVGDSVIYKGTWGGRTKGKDTAQGRDTARSLLFLCMFLSSFLLLFLGQDLI